MRDKEGRGWPIRQQVEMTEGGSHRQRITTVWLKMVIVWSKMVSWLDKCIICSWTWYSANSHGKYAHI